MKQKTKQAKIYVGLNDSEKHEQLFEKDRYVHVLKNVCRSYHTAFSFDVINGGYFHDDGTYVEETSLELTLLEVSDELVREIAKDLCVFFHQESVMITENEIRTFFVSETLE